MIEPTIAISLGALVCSLVFGAITAVHNNGGDIRQQIEQAKLEAARSAKIETALQGIQSDTKEIREDQKVFRNAVADLNQKMLSVEQSVKSAHHRIDEIVHKDGDRKEKNHD